MARRWPEACMENSPGQRLVWASSLDSAVANSGGYFFARWISRKDP